MPGVDGFLIGGSVDPAIGATEGTLAAAAMAEFNVDVALISTSGWSLSRGITAPGEGKRALKRAVMSVATKTLLVADSTKYGAASMVRVCSLDDVDGVITDWGLNDDTARRISELGVDLHIAPKE